MYAKMGKPKGKKQGSKEPGNTNSLAEIITKGPQHQSFARTPGLASGSTFLH